MQRRQISIMVQQIKAMLNKFDLFTVVYLHDVFVVDFVFDLFDPIHTGNLFVLDPLGEIGDERSNDKSEGKQNILNYKDCYDESGPWPVAIRAKFDKFFRGEND